MCYSFFLLLPRLLCFHRRGSLYFSAARYPRGGYFCRVSQNGTYKSRIEQGLLRPVFTVTALKMLVMEKPLLRFLPCYSKNRTQNSLTYPTFICLPKRRFKLSSQKRNSQRRICGGKSSLPIHCDVKSCAKLLSLWNPQAEQETTVNRCSHERFCFSQVRVRLCGFVQTFESSFVLGFLNM